MVKGALRPTFAQLWRPIFARIKPQQLSVFFGISPNSLSLPPTQPHVPFPLPVAVTIPLYVGFWPPFLYQHSSHHCSRLLILMSSVKPICLLSRPWSFSLRLADEIRWWWWWWWWCQLFNAFNNFKLIQHHCHYDLRQFNFTNRVIPIWNSLSNHVVSADTINTFNTQDVLYDYKAYIDGIGPVYYNVAILCAI